MQFCSVEKCSYPNFGKDKLTGLPYCRNHQTKRTDFDRRSIIQKAIAKNKSLGSKIRGLQNIDDEEKNEQELWFLMRMNTCEPVCENCGAERFFIKENDKFKKQWRSCQAHLLPKRHFESLKTHPLNGMVLGTGYSGMCNCHDEYDSSWEAASKMNIWPEVIRRVKIMYPLIRETEKRFIPQVLLDELTVIEQHEQKNDTEKDIYSFLAHSYIEYLKGKQDNNEGN